VLSKNEKHLKWTQFTVEASCTKKCEKILVPSFILAGVFANTFSSSFFDFKNLNHHFNLKPWVYVEM
jgi:hypothetical protein